MLRNGDAKPASKLKTGDEITTHFGSYATVRDTVQRRYSGTLLSVETFHPFTKFQGIPTQPILTFPNYNELDPLRKYLLVWCPIGDIEIGSSVLAPWSAALQNTKYRKWLNEDPGKVVKDISSTTALGVVLLVTRIVVTEVVRAEIFRFTLDGDASCVANGLAVQA